jgi:hypothetical protein
MSYEERFTLTKETLVRKIKDAIYENHNNYFDMWLDCEVDLQENYLFYFKKYFENYLTKEMEHEIYFAGDNLVYAIKAYIKMNEDYDIHDILQYAELFIDTQMDDFDNWCDLSMTMYVDEEVECEIKECHNFLFCQNKDKDWVIEQHGGTCADCWMYFGQIKDTNENKECNICNETKNIIKIACNHEMCYDCWKKIADDHHNVPTKCPYCRAQIGAWKIPE